MSGSCDCSCSFSRCFPLSVLPVVKSFPSISSLRVSQRVNPTRITAHQSIDFFVTVIMVVANQLFQSQQANRPTNIEPSFPDPLDAAAALDARCLQTFADTGDFSEWCVCNDASAEHLAKNSRQLLLLDPLKKRKKITCKSRRVRRQCRDNGHNAASAPRGRPMLRGAMSSPEQTLCNHRFVVDSGNSVIFLKPMPWAAFFSWRRVPVQVAI